MRVHELGSEVGGYKVEFDSNPFGFVIQKADNPKDFIFDSRLLPGLTFSEQFLLFSAKLPTRNVYGIGEQYHQELRRCFQYCNYSLFSHDAGPHYSSNLNIYGFHPFFMGLTLSNQSYGVYLHNTYGMNIIFQPNPDRISYRVIGGELDFYFFLGPTSDNVIQQYTRLIGRPQLPPYWSLGTVKHSIY